MASDLHKACCDNCKFYWTETKGKNGAHCRRFPPGVVYAETQGAAFPWVLAHWWCGEHVEKQTDEDEKQITTALHLLDKNYPKGILTPRMQDWMDLQDVPKDTTLRRRLLVVACLAQDGLSLNQIKEHRFVKRKSSLVPHIDAFYKQWKERGGYATPHPSKYVHNSDTCSTEHSHE